MTPIAKPVELVGIPNLNHYAVIDNTAKFSLPFNDITELIGILSTQDAEADADTLASSSSTENRAYALPSMAIEFTSPAGVKLVFADLLVKGGGGDAEEGAVGEFDDKHAYLGPYPKYFTDEQGNRHVIRFLTKDPKFTTLSSYFGIHVAGDVDHVMGEFFRAHGLETRALVGIWELPPDLEIFADDRYMTVREFENIINQDKDLASQIRLSIEVWAMDTRFRFADIISSISMPYAGGQIGTKSLLPPYYFESKNNYALSHQADALKKRLKQHFEEVVIKEKFPGSNLVFLFQVKDLQQKQEIEEEIIKRTEAAYLETQIKVQAMLEDTFSKAQFKSDSKWKALYHSYKNWSATADRNPAQFKGLVYEYIHIAAKALANAVSVYFDQNAAIGMNNPQNFTLLCSIVDNDVAVLFNEQEQRVYQLNADGSRVDLSEEDQNLYKINPQSFYDRQFDLLAETWSFLANIICSFSLVNLIDIGDSLDQQKKFLEELLLTFTSTLSTILREHGKDQVISRIKTVAQERFTKEMTVSDIMPSRKDHMKSIFGNDTQIEDIFNAGRVKINFLRLVQEAF